MSTAPSASNSIEFLCHGCGRTLKVPTSAAGKRASCPQCATVVQVPNATPGANGESAAPPTPPPPSSNPFQQPTSTASSLNFGQPSSQPAIAFGPPPSVAPPQPAAAFGATSAPFAQAAPAPFGQPPAPTPFQPQSQPGSSSPHANVAPLIPAGTAPAPAGRDTPTRKLFDQMTEQIAKIYVGQDELVLGTLVALFSNGHVLIESVPGLGKTLFVRTLGRVLGCQFGRIQFTADLMPSDITGAPIFDMKTNEFRFRPGPVFTQLLLADEINRAPAKTHAALLEIMQEFCVTVDGKTHTIDRPFLVLATQNPIESEGTYNLPEAQLDRFMFKLMAQYPREDEEAQILKMHSQQKDVTKQLAEEVTTVASPPDILATIKANSEVRVDDRLVDYINRIVRLTRSWKQFHMGASPRAGLAIMQAIRTLAAFSGRDYAVPDDVFQIILPALRHRVMLTAEAEVEGYKIDDVLTEMVRSVEVPRI